MADRRASTNRRQGRARAIVVTRQADLSRRILTSLIALAGLATTLLVLTNP